MNQQRWDTFKGLFKDYEPDEFAKSINPDEHRYVAVEKSDKEPWRYVSGHATLRAACDYMASMGGNDADAIYDLDTGERIEVDVFVHVIPKRVAAVLEPMSVAEATAALAIFRESGDSVASLSARLARALSRQ